ncbi:MAG: universal stress protein [Myxococcota bacterium]
MSPEPAPVVVPVDPSPSAFRILAGHTDRLQRAGRVHLVHVVDAATTSDATSEVARARDTLTGLARRYDLPSATVIVLEGRVGEALRSYAEAVEAHAILIPSQGSPGGSGFLLGPVAEALVHRAPCPVRILWARSGPSPAVAA